MGLEYSVYILYVIYIPSVQEQFQGENVIMKCATYAKKKKKKLPLNLELDKQLPVSFSLAEPSIGGI